MVMKMLKKSISLLLAVVLLCSALCFGAVAASSGQISEDLSWTLDTTGRLTISGSGAAMPDYSAENPAPWAASAGAVRALSLPGGLRYIGAFAFADCAHLESADLSRITALGQSAFARSGLHAAVLPYALKEIPESCFAQCDALESITFSEMHSGEYGARVEGTARIGAKAFEFCTALKAVTTRLGGAQSGTASGFPATLAELGEEAFSECRALAGISFADSGKAVKTIGAGAFSGCVALSSISIPAGISEIKENTFAQSGLVRADLPATIEAVGTDAFAFCPALKRVDVRNNACTFAASENTTPDKAVLYVVFAAKNALSYAERYGKPVKVLCSGRAESHGKFSVVSTDKASALKPGNLVQKCGSCGYVKNVAIAQVQPPKLTKTKFYYTGKKIVPTAAQVQMFDSTGKAIPASNFTVTCQTKGIAVGKHSVKIQFKAGSNYSGSFVRYYTIVLKGSSVQWVDSGSAKLRVHWAKQTVGTTGYQVQLCKNKNFKSGVILKTVWSPKATDVLLTSKNGLARKTGYYIRVRTFQTVGKNKYVFSSWSAAFGRKTK